jgi:uncharacterized protein YodC (DUF2158 family)
MNEGVSPVTAEAEVGSVVWLKTGSPALVVTGLKRNDSLLMLEWFNGSELHRDAFDPQNLAWSDPFRPIVMLEGFFDAMMTRAES